MYTSVGYIPLKAKQITPLRIEQSPYFGSPIVSQPHFPLLKLSCHKLQEKIIMKLIDYTFTRHKPSKVKFSQNLIRLHWTPILIPIFFWQLHICFFSYHREDNTILSKQLMPNSLHLLLLFSPLCKIITHKESIKYYQNTRKRLHGVQNFNTRKWLVK